MGVYHEGERGEEGRILGGIAGEYRMQFMKCPQTTTTIFSGRACCGRLLDYHIARHGGRYSSFLDRFPNTHTYTEGGRRGVGRSGRRSVAAGRLCGCEGEGGRKGAGGRAGAR